MGPKDADEILSFLLRETGIILPLAPEKISDSASLASLGFDSMSFVELLISIEKKYNVKLIELGIQSEDVKTLGALAARLQRAL